MDIITTTEASKKWNITPRRIAMLASQGRIPGAVYVDNRWLIPANAAKPSDGRTTSEKNRSTDQYVFPNILYAISNGFPVSRLNKEEKELYGAYMQYEAGEFAKSIDISNKLLSSTNNVYIRIGAYNMLGYSYVYQREFEKAFSSMLSCIDAYSSAKDDRLELALMINELKYYLSNRDWINQNFRVYDFAPQSDFEMAYCSWICIIQELSQISQGIPYAHCNIHELALLQLENEGYEYIAMQYHFLLAVIYANVNNNEMEVSHVTKALDLAIKNNTYSSMSAYAFVLYDTVSRVLENYPEEFRQKFNHLVELSTSVYSDYIVFSGGNRLLSKIKPDDYTLLVYCMRNYTIQEIAKCEDISLSKAKRKLSNLYDRLGVNGKKDLVETLASVMIHPISKVAQ